MKKPLLLLILIFCTAIFVQAEAKPLWTFQESAALLGKSKAEVDKAIQAKSKDFVPTDANTLKMAAKFNGMNTPSRPTHHYTVKGYTFRGKRRLVAVFDNNVCMLMQYSIVEPSEQESESAMAEMDDENLTNKKDLTVHDDDEGSTKFQWEGDLEDCTFNLRKYTNSTAQIMTAYYKPLMK